MAEKPSELQGKDLVALARARFGDLSAAELKLLEAAPKGELAICSPSADPDNPANDPAMAGKWGKDREIRAELIRWLCSDNAVRDQVDRRGIFVLGARVVGRLNLFYTAIPFGLAFRRCRLLEDANFHATELLELDLQGTWVRSLAADGMSVKSGAFLNKGFRANGTVRLAEAKIGGSLECGNSVFHNPAGTALVAERVTVKGSVILNGSCIHGEVRLVGAHIEADLSCVGATLDAPIHNGEGGSFTLIADRVVVGGSIFLKRGFRATGEVHLLGAEIGSNLDCGGGVFVNPSGIALNCDRMIVGGSVFLRNGFQAEGTAMFLGARVGSNFECDGSIFRKPRGVALGADGMSVKGDVFLRNGFRAEGEVRLLGAQVGGELVCEKAVFRNLSGAALSADGISVKGSVFLNNGFRAEGAVRLLGAQVGGALDCTNSAFTNHPMEGIEGSGNLLGKLDAEGATIKGTLFWTRIANSGQAQLDLRNAAAGSFEDDGEKSWPSPGNLFLDGFVYARFSGGPRSAKERLDWLNRLNSFTPQPYRQLAKVLRDEGDDDGAIEVLVEMASREESGRSWSEQAPRLLFRAIGYGYRPLWAVWELAILTGIGWVLYRRAYLAGAMTPVEKEAYREFKSSGSPPNHYRRFSPFIYSLENSLPLVKFGQADSWQPEPDPGRAVASTEPLWAKIGSALRWRKVLPWLLLAQILLGWILATLFAAGVTGLVR
jgi:sRNA-binding regulator protein Hfq